VIERCGDQLDVYSGDDALGREIILQGGKGIISVTANVAPQAMHELCAAALKGDRETADAIDKRLQGLHRDLFLESNPIPVKWAVHDMGLIPPGIRLPLTPFSDRYYQQLRQSMRQAGI
jgi:4-hydroxy-tetrahydrodipicolinate synthase